MEQSLSDTQHRLSVKMNELRAAHEQIEKLEERIGEYLGVYEVQDWLLLLYFCCCCCFCGCFGCLPDFCFA